MPYTDPAIKLCALFTPNLQLEIGKQIKKKKIKKNKEILSKCEMTGTEAFLIKIQGKDLFLGNLKIQSKVLVKMNGEQVCQPIQHHILLMISTQSNKGSFFFLKMKITANACC